MKKILFVLLALLMMAMTATTVFAAEDEFVIGFGEPTYNEDGTITVDLVLENNPGFTYLAVRLTYDKDILSYEVDNATGLTMTSGKNIVFNDPDVADYTESGKIATLTFTPVEGAPHADFEVVVDTGYFECFNAAEADVTFGVEPVTLTLAHDIVAVEAKEATCTENGNKAYWYCQGEFCGMVWEDEALTALSNRMNVVVPAGHDLVHMEAVEPACHYEGNIEHWYCTKCETVWSDEALTQITNHLSVILPEVGGDVVHVDAVPNCGVEGNIEYWYCETCEQVWQDEARTQLTNFKNVKLPAGEHEIVHMEAVEPGCHYEGNIEHWYCTKCEIVWADEEMTQVTNHLSVILPATGEGEVVHMEAVEPDCHYEGNIEYWTCYTCEQVWQDEALTQLTNRLNVVLPEVGGDVIHVEATEATKDAEGNIEHWYCEECEQVWQDEAMTQLTNHKNVIIPKLPAFAFGDIDGDGEVYAKDYYMLKRYILGSWVPPCDHDLVHMEAVEPGCHYEGHIEHWYCLNCETVWADEELTQVTNHLSVILPELGGDVVHMEAVEPGCHYTGNIEYWTCYACEQVWQDEALTQLTNRLNVVLPELGGEVVHVDAVPNCGVEGNIEHWYCEECEQVWQDEARTQLTNHLNVKLPVGEHNIVHMEAVEPGCHYEGNIEHWYCTVCETVWADEELTQITNHLSVILPELGGEVVHVEAVASTTEAEGNIEHWYCEECEQVWQDEALTQLTNRLNVKLPKLEAAAE